MTDLSKGLRARESRRATSPIIAGVLGACALAVLAVPASVSAAGQSAVRTAQCPVGKTVQLQWENTDYVDLYGTAGRQLDSLHYIARYHAGSNSYNTGASVFTWGFGASSTGDVTGGTGAFVCVNFRP